MSSDQPFSGGDLEFQGKEIKLENVVIAGFSPSDEPDYSDAYIESASWEDTGEDLTDAELERIPDDVVRYHVEEHASFVRGR